MKITRYTERLDPTRNVFTRELGYIYIYITRNKQFAGRIGRRGNAAFSNTAVHTSNESASDPAGVILEKKWEYNEEVHQLFIDFKKAYDSVRRGVLYKILIEFGIPRKLLRLIKMRLTETCCRVRVSKNVSDRFPIRNGLKQ